MVNKEEMGFKHGNPGTKDSNPYLGKTIKPGPAMEVKKLDPGKGKSNPYMPGRGPCELTGGQGPKQKSWLGAPMKKKIDLGAYRGGGKE